MIICRVCFDSSGNLILLRSDNIESLPIIHMLKEFTIIDLEQHLPKYICETCTGQLDIAYEFKRKYEDAAVKYVRQMLDPAEIEETMTIDSREETMTIDSSSSMTEDIPDRKPHETMHFNCTEINDFPVNEELTQLTAEDRNFKDAPQLLSLDLNNLQQSDDVKQLSSDPTINGSQYELAERSSICNDSKLNSRALPQAVLRKIYKHHYGHGKKPFQCDVCCRWFKTKGHIKIHRIRHIERENRFKCNKCLLMFLTKPHFNKHRCFTKL